MSSVWIESIITVFVIFCRVGGCLMVMPGFGHSRIPMNVRLFMAISATLALTPLLFDKVSSLLSVIDLKVISSFGLGELFIGMTIGLVGRVFFAALETIATLAAMCTGFSGPPGIAVDPVQPLSALANIITLTAVTLIFLSELHWEVLAAIVDSYDRLPPLGIAEFQAALRALAASFSETFFLALRIGSPFIIYSVIINLATGMINKLTPQIPIYFVIMPLAVFGGLILSMFIIREMMFIFIDAYGNWLRQG